MGITTPQEKSGEEDKVKNKARKWICILMFSGFERKIVHFGVEAQPYIKIPLERLLDQKNVSPTLDSSPMMIFKYVRRASLHKVVYYLQNIEGLTI